MSYFLPGHFWRGRKYISPKNACLRHSRHALMCLQFIRENENSTHFCSKLLAKNGFYFSVLFDFCWLFTRVWTGCIVFSFPPFALDSCFLLFPCAAHFSLFPALFKTCDVFPRFRTVTSFLCFWRLIHAWLSAAVDCFSVFPFFLPIALCPFLVLWPSLATIGSLAVCVMTPFYVFSLDWA